MNVLAIETATAPGSIALRGPSGAWTYQPLHSSQHTARQFAVLIQQLLQQERCVPPAIDLVAASGGPGSFTGLRIGITAAKVFAYATGARVMAVDTLELLASQLDAAGQVVAVLDAGRGQVYSATFAKDDKGLRAVEPTGIQDVDRWLAALGAHQTITGPGLTTLWGRLPDRVRAADPDLWQPRADALGKLALAKHQRGERQDLWSLCPQYYRRSAAEEITENPTRGR